MSHNAKNYLKAKICDAVSKTSMTGSKPVRKNLEDVLFKMVITDFPNNWQDCLSNIMNRMNTAQNPNELYGSLLCVKSI